LPKSSDTGAGAAAVFLLLAAIIFLFVAGHAWWHDFTSFSSVEFGVIMHSDVEHALTGHVASVCDMRLAGGEVEPVVMQPLPIARF
jgi:hypothetical protein